MPLWESRLQIAFCDCLSDGSSTVYEVESVYYVIKEANGPYHNDVIDLKNVTYGVH